MISPWRSPLPLSEYTAQEVVVYFYSGRWIPIMFCRLAEAIALYRRALLTGKELFVFPPEVNPSDSSHSLHSSSQIVELGDRLKERTLS